MPIDDSIEPIDVNAHVCYWSTLTQFKYPANFVCMPLPGMTPTEYIDADVIIAVEQLQEHSRVVCGIGHDMTLGYVTGHQIQVLVIIGLQY